MTSSDPYPVLLLLQAHLEGRLHQGETRLWLTKEATKSLREMVKMRPRPRPAEIEDPGEPVATDHVKLSPASAALSAPVAEPNGRKVEEPPAMVASSSSIPAEPLPMLRRLTLPEMAPPAPLSPAEKETRLAEVRARALEGEEAKRLGTLRETMVFATGSPMADIVFVGEAPGAEEERQREPFVGPAGQLLTRVLKVMGLERGQVYITNICKYRPAMENQGSGNRQPSPLEMASCLEFVREELAIIRPKVIVALGGTAITGLLGFKTGVMNARGRFYDFDGVPVMATLHPSYLLRKEQEGPAVANAEKRKLWEDMLMVMERAGMPITDRQRAIFLPK